MGTDIYAVSFDPTRIRRNYEFYEVLSSHLSVQTDAGTFYIDEDTFADGLAQMDSVLKERFKEEIEEVERELKERGGAFEYIFC